MAKQYYDGPSMIVPEGYETDTPKNKGMKKFIIIIAAILVLLTVLGAIAFVLVNKSKTDPEDDIETDEADYIFYDISDQITGGEEYLIPENESLDFLRTYDISENDILLIGEEIRGALDEHYEDGYNDIYYDLDSAHFNELDDSDADSFISFDFKTDADETSFHVLAYLDENNEVSSVLVVQKK